MGESGLRFSWSQLWSYLLALPRPHQEAMAIMLDRELVTWLPFRSPEVQREVLERAPQALIDSLKRRRVKYSKPGSGEGYMPAISPQVVELLDASRGIKPESRKSKRKGGGKGKHHE